jgi:hypothetical protein
MMQAGVHDDDIERGIGVGKVLGVLRLLNTVYVGELEVDKSDLAHDALIQRSAADDQDAVGSRYLARSDEFPEYVTIETGDHVAHGARTTAYEKSRKNVAAPG